MAEPADRTRRRGGQELPDEAQDRPEQNAGYDEAAHGGGTPGPHPEDFDATGDSDLPPDDETGPDVRAIDDEAARRAAADVRRRDRRSR